MQEIRIKSVRQRVSRVKKIINGVGDHFFSVHFITRSDGSKRRMSCRKHVIRAQYAPQPKGKKKRYNPAKYNLMTVLDANAVRYNHKNRICGRGNWKSIPLDSIYRICAEGQIYKFV